MGVLYDYYRARDGVAAAVADGPEWSGPLFPRIDVEPFDGVTAKGVDPEVTLAKVVGFVQGVPYSLGLVESTVVQPQPSQEEDERREQGVLQLGDRARDILAGVTAEQVPELVARWIEIEEFAGHAEADKLAEILVGLAALSRRAKTDGDHLFCWWSL